MEKTPVGTVTKRGVRRKEVHLEDLVRETDDLKPGEMDPAMQRRGLLGSLFGRRKLKTTEDGEVPATPGMLDSAGVSVAAPGAYFAIGGTTGGLHTMEEEQEEEEEFEEAGSNHSEAGPSSYARKDL